jgi:GNAT superfamily N-acetyltransferase
MAAVPAISVRRFSRKDLPKISLLITDTIKRCYLGIYPPKAVRFFLDYHAPENIVRDATAGTTLVGWLDETPVATATLNGSYISRVFVRPENQGQGLGNKLANELERLAIERGVEQLKLDASLTSRQFWEKLGWRVMSHEVEMVDEEQLEYFKMMKELVKSTSV